MTVTDQQVRKLMSEYQKTGKLEKAALRAGIDRKTARKYVRTGQLPSQCRRGHGWQTRPDPFAPHWVEVETLLRDAPELEAKALFDWLCERHPDQYQAGQLRTLQRRVQAWRALHGPAQEVFFAQTHVPGQRLQTDFTCLNSLGVRIGGEAFSHRLCHSVLTYSNWEWGTVCQTESYLALKHGVQAALVRLWRVPQEHWTDHSTAATHRIGVTAPGQWEFNDQYRSLLAHYGIAPRTINIAQPHENGDVESANGALKRRLGQHLLLRGSREFASVGEYKQFVWAVLDKANRTRHAKLAEELAAMRVLTVDRLPDYEEVSARVSRGSTIQVDCRAYSVPSRLIGQTVQVHCYEEHLEVFCRGQQQLTMPRGNGRQRHAVNYRHVIDWLVRKPGAFRQYRYREDLFPSLAFRQAYDALQQACSPRTADLEYLRVLQEAAHTMESTVEQTLIQIAALGQVPRWSTVLEFLPRPPLERPALPALAVNLAEYDPLIGVAEAHR
jgi:hypothetical protein